MIYDNCPNHTQGAALINKFIVTDKVIFRWIKIKPISGHVTDPNNDANIFILFLPNNMNIIQTVIAKYVTDTAV